MRTNTGAMLQRLIELQTILSSLLGEDLDDMSAAVQLECLQVLRPSVCQIQALQLRLVGLIDRHRSASAQGAASTATWLRNTLHMPRATEVVRSAAVLSRLPAVAEALATGDINDAHVATIARVVDALPSAEPPDGMEELLVTQARKLAPSRFGPVAARIREQTVAADATQRENEREISRSVRVRRQVDGRVGLNGRFDTESGSVVLAAIAAVASPMPSEDGRRGLDARQADALVAICQRVMDTASPDGLERTCIESSPGDRQSTRDNRQAPATASAAPSTGRSGGAARRSPTDADSSQQRPDPRKPAPGQRPTRLGGLTVGGGEPPPSHRGTGKARKAHRRRGKHMSAPNKR